MLLAGLSIAGSFLAPYPKRARRLEKALFAAGRRLRVYQL